MGQRGRSPPWNPLPLARLEDVGLRPTVRGDAPNTPNGSRWGGIQSRVGACYLVSRVGTFDDRCGRQVGSPVRYTQTGGSYPRVSMRLT